MDLSEEELRLARNAYQRMWKKKNKEKVNAINRAVKAKNPDKYKEINRRSAAKRRIERPELKEYARACSSARYKADPEARQREVLAWVDQHPGYYLLKNAQYRARNNNLPFDITLADIVIPEFCPVLGIKIVPGRRRKGFLDASPSIDKIVPSKGYVRGNICVISGRANRLKSDGTAAEMRAIADYIERETRHPVTGVEVTVGDIRVRDGFFERLEGGG